MGLFTSQKKTKNVSPKKMGDTTLARNITEKILRPRITEKAMRVAEKNVFIFEVHNKATKTDIRDAIRTIYGVSPTAIRMLNQQPRTEKRKDRAVRVAGLKKAYVYLKEGDTITLA